MPQPSEHLEIEGFAGIKCLSLEVPPFTVLIGPQSVGKSIVAKLLYLFKKTPRFLYLKALGEDDVSASEVFLDRFAESLPAPTQQKGSARITYSVGRSEFVLSHAATAGATWEVKIPAPFERAYKQLKAEMAAAEEVEDPDDFRESFGSAKSGFQMRIDRSWPEANMQPRFVPAGRSFFFSN
jgi:predicted ATP-dependent endonuclease of OLD family